MPDLWADRVRGIRRQLKLSQQGFGTLIGISARSVSQWETERAVPDRLSKLLLWLLTSALGVHSRATVVGALREVGPKPKALVLAMAWLLLNPGDRKAVVRLPDTLIADSPPSSAVPSSF